MKQTNNAIKFLMAQYRAIFKNAYFKGIATALVLTAGLAAGAAQANTGYVGSGGWTYTDDEFPNMSAGDYQLAGQIAGDALTGSSPTITENKASNTAEGGTLIIGNYDPKGKAMGTGFMASGTAAGNWASSNNLEAHAISGSVTVNGAGFVNDGGKSNRGVIYGGWAQSVNGAASAISNTVTVTKSVEARSTAAASKAIRAGRAVGNTGAIAMGNTVNISGSSGALQSVAVGSGADFIGIGGGIAQAKVATSTGNYITQGNEITLSYIEANNAANGLNFSAGETLLQQSSGSGQSINNYLSISDSTINVSGGYLSANRVTHGSGTTTAKIDGQGRGLTIINSDITSNVAPALRIIANTIQTESTGDASAVNGNVEISHTDITGQNVLIMGTSITNEGKSTTASNNKVSITEESSNRVTASNNTVSYTNQIQADITGVMINNSSTESDLTIEASSNTIDVGSAVSVTGDVVGVSVQASGDKFASFKAENNSVSVASKVVGNVKAVHFDNQASTVSGSVSFLNNDVSLLNGADVSSGDLVGGAGKDSVLTIAAGSTYTANQDDGNSIASDVIDIDGTVVVDASKELTISGFFKDGDEDASEFHENLTTVGSTAVFKNAGTINVYGKVMAEDGAVFTGTGANSKIVVDASKGVSDLDSLLAPENQVENADLGVLGMSSAQLKSYLAADKVLSSTTNDNAGRVVLQSGGALELTDTANVDIATTFNFISGDGTSGAAGQIEVSGTGIVRGNEITISRQLAKNAVTTGNITAATTYDGLYATGMSGIQIEANTLHLGASDLSSAKSEDILFNKATAKNVINFYGLHNDTKEDDIKNDGFHLVSNVYGDNYMVTTDQDTGLQYYTALDGDINGDVTITNDDTVSTQNSGSLTIQNGNWVAHGNVTLNESGSLTVGGDDGIDETGAANK